MPKTALISLATRDGKADTPGLPASATHVLMFWPPTWETMREGIRKRLARSGQWTIYTVSEFEAGDYCKGDRWLLESSRHAAAGDLTAWTAGELGQPVTLQPAGETEYGPVYWVLPAGSR